jgi:transposase
MRKAYPSDISDVEWEVIEPLLPKPQPRGPKANVELREIVNGIFYLLHEGCQWRSLPHDLPPWQTVSSYFRKWQRKGIWLQVNTTLREQLREQMGRNQQPSAGAIDSQSVKTTEKRGRFMAMTATKKSKGANVIF